VFEEVAI